MKKKNIETLINNALMDIENVEHVVFKTHI